MAQGTLPERVAALEETVAGLQGLPNQLASMKTQFEAQFKQIETRFEQVDARFDQLEATLRHEIRGGDEQTRDFMRALHEDVITRIAMLGGNGPSRAAPVKRPRPRRPKR